MRGLLGREPAAVLGAAAAVVELVVLLVGPQLGLDTAGQATAVVALTSLAGLLIRGRVSPAPKEEREVLPFTQD